VISSPFFRIAFQNQPYQVCIDALTQMINQQFPSDEAKLISRMIMFAVTQGGWNLRITAKLLCRPCIQTKRSVE
jgi:hypothetical protein